MNTTFLEDLCSCVSVSGKEEAIQRLIKKQMEDVCDRFMSDASGNLVSVIHPDAKRKVLLCAHIDEIGFYVNRIYPDGSLGVIKVGGVHPVLYLATQVLIVGEHTLPGVVMTHAALETKEAVKAEDLRIDIGCETKEEASALVHIGDAVCASCTLQSLQNDRFSGRAIDDKGGAFIILEAIRKAHAKGASIGMYAATTCGEETTRRGAYHAAVNIDPECAIIVDVTYASDYQGVQMNESGDIALGKGPVLCCSSVVNKAMQERMQALAKKHHIPIQHEVMPGFTFTDGDTIHLSNKGIPICLVSLPLRYMHSSIETADWRDVSACIDLIAEFLCAMEQPLTYCPQY